MEKRLRAAETDDDKDLSPRGRRVFLSGRDDRRSPPARAGRDTRANDNERDDRRSGKKPRTSDEESEDEKEEPPEPPPEESEDGCEMAAR